MNLYTAYKFIPLGSTFSKTQLPSRAPAGTLLQFTGCIPAFSTRGKGALGPLLSAPGGASKRETPTSNLTESNAWWKIIIDNVKEIRNWTQ